MRSKVKLLILIVSTILVPFISGSAFATATATSYANMAIDIRPVNPDIMDWFSWFERTDGISGQVRDSLGNFGGFGGENNLFAMYNYKETPYAYQESYSGGYLASKSMAEASSDNRWADASGGGYFLLMMWEFYYDPPPIYPPLEVWISIDYNASLYGSADSKGAFSSGFEIWFDKTDWSLRQGITGINETRNSSYSGHVEFYYCDYNTYNFPPAELHVYLDTYARAVNTPEPGTMLLLGSGLIGLLGYGSRYLKK